MQQGELFSNAFVCHTSLATRLVDGLREALTEFKQNPSEFFRNSFRKDPATGRRRSGMRLGLAIALVFYLLFAFTVLVLWSGSRLSTDGETVYTIMDRPLFNPGPSQNTQTPETNSDKDEGGGGGGGHHQITPAASGSLPTLALTDSIIAPSTKPQLTPPDLPVPLTLKVDPRASLPHYDSLLGLPNSVPGPPSDGPGNNGGIGAGDYGGIGNDKGRGYGPGHDYNYNGGRPSIGGAESAGQFDTAPIPLNRPRPNYTEEARQKKVQGIVRARVLVGADGQVKQVAIRQGLPAGLDEEAIRAAYLMRFTPATKSGHPIAAWVTMEIEFNLR